MATHLGQQGLQPGLVAAVKGLLDFEHGLITLAGRDLGASALRQAQQSRQTGA
jgi:hypothetical protein